MRQRVFLALQDGEIVIMTEQFQSTDDRRIENNVMRHEYRTLNDREKKQMQKIKDLGLHFHSYLDGMVTYDADKDGNAVAHGSRELSLAKTKIEEAVMWAVKHITR